MKLSDQAIAYQLQKKNTKNQTITAYKVGASNVRSSRFFNCSDILLGGINRDNIFYGEITKNYPIAEVEIISRVRFNSENVSEFECIEHFIGLECPDVVVDNPDGSAFICIADNCSAGDLVVYGRLEKDFLQTVSVKVNGEIKIAGSSENLIFPVQEIISKTISIINTHTLCCDCDEIFIATGGLTDVFALSSGDHVEFIYE